MSEKIIPIGVDTRTAQQQLAALQKNIKFTEDTLLTTLRKSHQSLILIMELFGEQLPAIINYSAQAAFMIAEMFHALGQAETISGIMAFKAGLTFASAYAIFLRGLTLASEAERMRSSMVTMISLSRTWVTW